ncbi:MAG: hypothetical protein RSA78_09125, partial [Oscillospiraceae bacterium]
MKKSSTVKAIVKNGCLIISMALIFNTFSQSFAFASIGKAQGDKVSCDFSSVINDDKTEEEISAVVKANAEGVTITGIKMPDGTVVHGNTAAFTATENKEYSFEVMYDEATTLPSVPEVVPPAPTVPEVVPPAPTVPEVAPPAPTVPEVAPPAPTV